MAIEQDLCRFLTKDGLCQIAEVVSPKPSASREIQTDVVALGGLPWTSTVRTVRTQICSAKDSPSAQVGCDCFVPRHRDSRTDWLANFQEG